MTPFKLFSVLLICFQIQNCYGRDLTQQFNDKSEQNLTNILCENEACVRKCCAHNEYVFKVHQTNNTKYPFGCKKYFTNFTLDFTDMKVYDEQRTDFVSTVNQSLLIIPGMFDNKTFLEKAKDFTIMSRILKVNLYLTEHGNLYQEVPNYYNRWKQWDANSFCIDYPITNMKSNKKPSPHIWFWFENNNKKPNKSYLKYGDLITCIFLLLVFVVYIVLPDLRNLGGMIVMACVFSLFWSYVLLYINQNHAVWHCDVLGLATYFFFMTSFCWMNIMSFDIWWTFRSYAKSRIINRRGECNKFIKYCVYAFGLPLVMTIAVGVVNAMDLSHMAWIVTPNIGKSNCFLEDGSKYLYIYIPMSILISMNWLFYLMTAFNVWRLCRGTKVLNLSNPSTVGQRTQWARLMVYLKLSVVMGLSWVFEMLSYKYPNHVIWKITDNYNIFIGLAIFLIFVCKKSIYRQLKKRFKTSKQNNNWSHTHSTKNVTSNFIVKDTSNFPVCINPRGPEMEV